ncbi:MAG: NCS2 family permease [Christensenellales bacterium]|jgi:AGZA family xanthine/uracil permease-like MFS transporter
MNNFTKKLDEYFNVTSKGSNIRTEITAGIATFMTMSYILLVNSDLLQSAATFNAIFIATAISSIIGTLIMALYARLPFAQAPGMGLNAFFIFAVIGGMGLSYGNALMVVLISGFLFLILTIIGLREKIVTSIPESLKLAIPAGIGLFIAFIGLQNAGIIQDNPATLVTLVKFSDIFTRDNPVAMHTAMSALVALITFIIIAVLSKKKIKGSILYGILAGSMLYYLFQLIMFRRIGMFMPDTGEIGKLRFTNPFSAFGEFFRHSFFKFSFKGLFDDGLNSVLTFITLVLSFAIVDMFDTIGTLVGTAKRAGMLREDGTIDNMKKALLSDSIATVAGAALGTSTVTTYVESSAGIAEGGKTGLTSLTVAVLFLIAMFFTPLAALIPSAATSAALIYVGVLMISALSELDFYDPVVIAPAFVTLIGMPLTYSISDGIGLGIITYLVIMLITGKIKQINWITYIIAALFILKFFVL